MKGEHLATEVVDRDEGLLLRVEAGTVNLLRRLLDEQVAGAAAADVAFAVAERLELDVHLFELVEKVAGDLGGHALL